MYTFKNRDILHCQLHNPCKKHQCVKRSLFTLVHLIEDSAGDSLISCYTGITATYSITKPFLKTIKRNAFSKLQEAFLGVMIA